MFQVSVTDGMPQKMCQDCAKALNFIYTFRKQALDTEKELKAIISGVTKSEEEYSLIKTEIEWKNENYDDFDSYNDYGPEDIILPKQEMEEKVFECNICKKQYTKEKKLLKHLASHEPTSSVCPYCGKKFLKQSTFDRHLLKHGAYENTLWCRY
jgi:uncharacterized C2H2 Zn-finger protein